MSSLTTDSCCAKSFSWNYTISFSRGLAFSGGEKVSEVDWAWSYRKRWWTSLDRDGAEENSNDIKRCTLVSLHFHSCDHLYHCWAAVYFFMTRCTFVTCSKDRLGTTGFGWVSGLSCLVHRVIAQSPYNTFFFGRPVYSRCSFITFCSVRVLDASSINSFDDWVTDKLSPPG